MCGFYDADDRIKPHIEMLPFFDRHIGGKVSVGAPETAD